MAECIGDRFTADVIELPEHNWIDLRQLPFATQVKLHSLVIVQLRCECLKPAYQAVRSKFACTEPADPVSAFC